ncbi:adenosylcobinamide-phosphate synthase CbiB [Sporosarcina sp. OR05]|uniref:adenosylcobinamide-phosphate synthase CbiB n=1 Tax=Sporosarcina sp. OR05 TaxID=2969819 RepID=UPI00352AA883
MIQTHFVAIAIGFLLDRLIGDPPNWPHPIRWIGTLITKLTAVLNKGRARILKGAGLLLMMIVIVTGIVLAIVTIAYQMHIAVGIAVEAVLIAIGLAQKSLRDAATEVYKPLITGDVQEARTKLSWIVGRDTATLQESDIARGAIETVSENTSDGVTAPLFWAFLFGAPGIWLYKTVNTLDSMVGYKDDRYHEFGKFSARADDILNFIPARMTGMLILLTTPNAGGIPFRQRFAGWRQDARRHPSPNSGYLEAATAWQLGVTLGGKSTYRGVVSERPQIGPGHRQLTAPDIQSTIVHMHIVSFVCWMLLTAIGVIIHAIT